MSIHSLIMYHLVNAFCISTFLVIIDPQKGKVQEYQFNKGKRQQIRGQV